MKETVLSAKTSGTATKGFEVIVQVIKKKNQKIFFGFFFTPCFIYFLGTCSVFVERVTYIMHVCTYVCIQIAYDKS